MLLEKRFLISWVDVRGIQQNPYGPLLWLKNDCCIDLVMAKFLFLQDHAYNFDSDILRQTGFLSIPDDTYQPRKLFGIVLGEGSRKKFQITKEDGSGGQLFDYIYLINPDAIIED